MTTTLLVDGNNILARAHHAANRGVEMSANGINTAALVIFVGLLAKYVKQVKPTHMLVCWDAGHAFRDALYPAYKSSRQKHEEGSGDTDEMRMAKEFLQVAGIPQRLAGGYEADDLIASTALISIGKVVILSGDKDLLQLVMDQRAFGHHWVQVTQIRPPDNEEWNEARVRDTFGVSPWELPQYLALVGDTVDGIPGVRGIGPKKALKVLTENDCDWQSVLRALGPDRAAEAKTMRQLVDLSVAYTGLTTGPAPVLQVLCPDDKNNPEESFRSAYERFFEFCSRHRLKTILERFEQGTLWDEPEVDEQLFDGFLATPVDTLDGAGSQT